MSSGLARIVGVQARYLREGHLGKALRGFTAMAERFLMRLRGPLHLSDGCACNLCGWRGPFFLSAYYYDHYRRGVFCPQCSGAERHRTLKLLLERELSGFFRARRRRVLDVAPIRRARDLFAFAEIEYLSFDLFSPTAAVRGDLRRTCFPDGCFDFVLCYHVLEHIPGERDAVREISRILRPGGLAILQVPWDPCAAETVEYEAPREAEEGHVRRYGRDVADRWESCGLTPRFSSTAYLLDESLVARHGLEREVLMLVEKP